MKHTQTLPYRYAIAIVTVVMAMAAMMANATNTTSFLFLIIYVTSRYISVMFSLFLPSMSPLRLML